MRTDALSPRGSPAARLASAVSIGLLVYASLFPNTGWLHAGVSPFAWISAPFPRYWTAAEILFNVLVYIPVGALLVWAVRPLLVGVGAVVVSSLVAAILSFSMECLQTFIAARVASNVDFAANSLGGFVGAVTAAASARRLIDAGWRAHWGDSILKPGTQASVVIAAMWILVQIPPQAMLFGTGNIMALVPEAVMRLEALLPMWSLPSPAWRARGEQWCTTLAILGVTMLVMHCLRPLRWRAVLVPVFIMVALAVKVASQPLTPPGGPTTFAWFTPGAIRGLVVGIAVAMACAYASPPWQRRLAITALAGQLLIVNLFPPDPYFLSSVATGYTGLLHMGSLAHELAAIWPIVAMGWMLFGVGSRIIARSAHPKGERISDACRPDHQPHHQ